MKLVPKAFGEAYEFLLMVVEFNTWAVRSLSVVDALGNVTEYHFSQETHNVPVADDAFQFEPPPGIEIVDASQP